MARATNESAGEGAMKKIVTSVQAQLTGSTSEGVVYPASLDQPASNNQGNGNMTAQVTAYSKACPNSKIVLMGYSQGAQVLGDVVSGGGTGTPGGPPFASPPLASGIMSKGKFISYSRH
ncbi:MAG: cutinase family protein, partial [Terriglobus roseus]|nr:cutinase family protein [Terriglobus roseus]